MKKYELKKIVESYKGYQFIENKTHIEIKFARYSFGKIYKNSNLIWFNLNSTASEVVKNVMATMLEYSNTPLDERGDKVHTFTDFEEEFLEIGGKNFPYIARDFDGELYCFEIKPEKRGGKWIADGEFYNIGDRFKHLFKSVQWEDKEPCEWGKWV